MEEVNRNACIFSLYGLFHTFNEPKLEPTSIQLIKNNYYSFKKS